MYYSNIMSKKYKILIAAVIFALIYIAISVFVMSEKTEHSPPQEDNSTQSETFHEDEEIAIEGEITCLSYKDTSGPTELSCALGLQEIDGKSFALRSDDSSLIGTIPTGQNVEIVGNFIPDKNSKYDIVGSIQVTKVIQK